jgi:hypothetical protein
VDQRFLPRIVEGEVRVLMIYDKPTVVVHKKPAEGQLSATLFSGARCGVERAGGGGQERWGERGLSRPARPQLAAAGGASFAGLPMRR